MMIMIAIPLTLLVITGGMFLLAKTQKENLGNLFKYISYFVIVVGFLALLCTTARGVKRMMGGSCMKAEKCMPMQMNCMQGGMGGCCNQMMMSGGCNHGMMSGCSHETEKCSKMRKECQHEMEEGDDDVPPTEKPVAPEQKK